MEQLEIHLLSNRACFSCLTYAKFGSVFDGDWLLRAQKNIVGVQGIKLEITSEERRLPLAEQKQQQPPHAAASAAAAEEKEERADREIVITGTVRGDRHWDGEEKRGEVAAAAASPQFQRSEDGEIMAATKSIEEGHQGEKQQQVRMRAHNWGRGTYKAGPRMCDPSTWHEPRP